MQLFQDLVAVLFVNCTTPPEVASSLTIRATFALDVVVIRVNTLIVLEHCSPSQDLHQQYLIVPVRTIDTVCHHLYCYMYCLMLSKLVHGLTFAPCPQSSVKLVVTLVDVLVIVAAVPVSMVLSVNSKTWS